MLFVSSLEKGHVHLPSGACNVKRRELELVLTSATQAADHEYIFLARSGEAVLHVQGVLVS